MGELSPTEVAHRADVDLAFVERLIALGIVKPDVDGRFTEGGIRRVRLAQMLELAGLDLAGLGAVIASGVLPIEMVEIATDERFASYGDETFAQVSQHTGVPIELVMAVREAGGAALPAADDRIRRDEVPVLTLIGYQFEIGIRAAVIERSLRVIGESLRRIAETEAGWWSSDLVAPALAAGVGWTGIAELSGVVSPKLSLLSDDAVLVLYHAHQTQAWMRNILEGVERTIVEAGFEGRAAPAPPAICFLDVTGYTRLTEERGDEAAAALADELARMVQRASGRRGGKPVKWLGDGVMFHFSEAGPAVVAALEMVESAAQTGLPPAHVGVHAGPVLFQDGDYFGRTVNVAARIADYARPGEVVVSQAVVDISVPPGVRFAEIGTVDLEGVSEALRLHVAGRL